MSIRLKLTLIYSTILTLTLVIFGVALYSFQAQNTLNSLKEDMVSSSLRLKNPGGDISSKNPPQNPANLNPLPPKRFDELSTNSGFQNIREREIVRVLDDSFNLVASPDGKIEDALPLSDEGKIILQSRKEWWEKGMVNEELMLIYSRPIISDGRDTYIVQVARPLTERNRTLRSLASTLSFASGITVIIAFGVGWSLSGFTLQPINRITTTAKKIGDKRDFSRRVDYDGPQDEIGTLANTFNGMLFQLEKSFKKVKKSLKQQRDFVADVSHELRTPLTTLRGNLELMQRNPRIPDDEQEDILNDMVEESDRLIRLVNNLLTLAYADAAQNMEKNLLDINPIILECVRTSKQLAGERKIISELSPNLVMLGNQDALKQIFLILIDNAIKHSSGDIKVTTTTDGENIHIKVQDNGDGIPPSELKQIFNRFHRGKNKTKATGFGLGLPIAKSLTQEMNGNISVKSNIRQGSTFLVEFPIYKLD